jgi:hypothetical protein
MKRSKIRYLKWCYEERYEHFELIAVISTMVPVALELVLEIKN